MTPPMVTDDVHIRQLGPNDVDVALRLGHLMDGPVREDATRRFLASRGHHLLVAQVGEEFVGFVTGVELTNPDKGTEMFLYELAVDERFRRRGIGRRLTETLAALARERGCYGMWVGTEADNAAALATYRAAGAGPPEPFVLLNWELP